MVTLQSNGCTDATTAQSVRLSQSLLCVRACLILAANVRDDGVFWTIAFFFMGSGPWFQYDNLIDHEETRASKDTIYGMGRSLPLAKVSRSVWVRHFHEGKGSGVCYRTMHDHGTRYVLDGDVFHAMNITMSTTYMLCWRRRLMATPNVSTALENK
jgi:hypothetical protein